MTDPYKADVMVTQEWLRVADRLEEAGFSEAASFVTRECRHGKKPQNQVLPAGDVEGDVRIGIWNGLRASGLDQEFAQIYLRAIMADPIMQRALSAPSTEGDETPASHPD